MCKFRRNFADNLIGVERAVSVDPETGRVYTADHKYLLVYDFEE